MEQTYLDILVQLGRIMSVIIDRHMSEASLERLSHFVVLYSELKNVGVIIVPRMQLQQLVGFIGIRCLLCDP